MSRIDVEVRYPHPIHRVWRALTDPKRIEEWLMKNDFEATVGHHFELRTQPRPGFAGVVHCEVQELVAERILAFTWVTDEIDTYVRFHLVPDGENATILRLEHSGFEGEEGEKLRTMLESGWASRILRQLLAQTLDSMAALEGTASPSHGD